MIEKISFWVLVLFGMIGAVFTTTIIHEFYHYYDLKDVTNADSICLFDLDLTDSNPFNALAGYYYYSIKENKTEEYKNAKNHAELKAYPIGYIALVIFAICACIVIWFRGDKEIENKILKEELEMLKNPGKYNITIQN